MSNDKTNQTTEQTQTTGQAGTAEQPKPDTAQAPAEQKGWLNGRIVAYTVVGAVCVAGIGAAAWALMRNPKAVEVAVDAAA